MDNEHEEREQEEQESQTLIPIVQETIVFHGKPLIVVRLPDGRPGVVLRWMCENLHLSSTAQVERIKRTEVIADDLVYMRVQTEGGPQIMPTLVLRSVPYWLATIDTRRMKKDDERRLEILNYQRNVVDALYAWAASTTSPLATLRSIVPAGQNVQPIVPAPDANALVWAEYHQQMAAFYQWKAATDMRIDALEERQGEMESRLDEHRRVLAFIPEILERLGPEKITPEHHRQVQVLAKQLHQATGKPFPTIYDELKTAFDKPRIEDLLEDDWSQIEHWLLVQIERAKKK